MDGNLLTTQDMCDYFKVRRETISRWKKKGMPYTEINGVTRFNEDEIMEWVRKQSHGGANTKDE